MYKVIDACSTLNFQLSNYPLNYYVPLLKVESPKNLQLPGLPLSEPRGVRGGAASSGPRSEAPLPSSAQKTALVPVKPMEKRRSKLFIPKNLFFGTGRTYGNCKGFRFHPQKTVLLVKTRVFRVTSGRCIDLSFCIKPRFRKKTTQWVIQLTKKTFCISLFV